MLTRKYQMFPSIEDPNIVACLCKWGEKEARICFQADSCQSARLALSSSVECSKGPEQMAINPRSSENLNNTRLVDSVGHIDGRCVLCQEFVCLIRMHGKVQVLALQTMIQGSAQDGREEVVYHIQSSCSILPAPPCPLQTVMSYHPQSGFPIKSKQSHVTALFEQSICLLSVHPACMLCSLHPLGIPQSKSLMIQSNLFRSSGDIIRNLDIYVAYCRCSPGSLCFLPIHQHTRRFLAQ